MLRTPLPPPPDRRRSTHELIEKPSVRPFLLDIQTDEFRSGHLLPKFPPVEALPKIDLEAKAPRAWRRDALHVVEVLGLVAAIAGVGVFAVNAREVGVGAASAPPIALGHSLDGFPNLFPIGPTQLVVSTPVAPTPKAQPAKPKPAKVWTAPAKAAVKTAASPKLDVTTSPAASPPAGPPASPAAPPPAPAAPPENPSLGVENPGF